MFSLFDRSAKKLRHERADVRREFLNSLSESKAANLQAELVDALEAETERSNRAQILAHLTDLQPLSRLLEGEHGDEVAAYLATQPKRAAAEQLGHPKVVRARLANETEPGVFSELLSGVTDQALLIELALSRKGELQDMVFAHTSFRSPAALQSLEQQSRGKDKRANRHARNMLQAIKDAAAAVEAADERIAKLRDSIARIAGQETETAVAKEGQRTHLLALKAEFEQAQDVQRQAHNEITALGQPTDVADHTDPFAAIDLAPPKESPHNGVIEALPKPGSGLSAEALRQALNAANADWETLSQSGAAPKSLSQAYTQSIEALHTECAALERIEQLETVPAPEVPASLPDDGSVWPVVKKAEAWVRSVRKSLNEVSWPSGIPEPSALTQPRADLERVQSAIAQISEQAEALAKSATSELVKAERSIEAGETQTAAETLASARQLIVRLPNARKGELDDQCASLQARLNELRDWKSFATSPKREALLASMQALVGDTREPERLADAIKSLRQEWNELGRPANRAEHNLATAFNDAAEQAFEPCRTHFAELGKAREANLAAREALVEQVRSYLDGVDWAETDLTAAEQIMRAARQEWRQAFPVPRGKGKAVEKQFEQLQSALHGELEKRWNLNVSAKEALIERARELSNSAEPSAQVNGIKTLQAEWKTVGPIPRHRDQKLWRAFREVCDAVFDQRKQAADARDAEFAEKRGHADAVNQALKAALSEPPTAKRLKELRNQFAEIGNLGRDGEPVARAHRDLVAQYENLLSDATRQAAKSRLLALAAEDARLAAEGGDTEFAELRNQSAADDPTAELQRLALLAEIAADRESPAEAGADRMALQVSLMNQGGGNAQLPSGSSLTKQWCHIGNKPVDEATAALRKRFFEAVATL